MSAYKIQKLGNHQKKEYYIQNMVKVLNQEKNLLYSNPYCAS
jgi:hypothetical protein